MIISDDPWIGLALETNRRYFISNFSVHYFQYCAPFMVIDNKILLITSRK